MHSNEQKLILFHPTMLSSRSAADTPLGRGAVREASSTTQCQHSALPNWQRIISEFNKKLRNFPSVSISGITSKNKNFIDLKKNLRGY